MPARASAAAIEGRKFGTIGHVGAFSFNYYKNMTCGEGGGVATNDDAFAERVRCAIDPCHFYWQGRNDAVKPFAGNGARASELMGAMLNVQLDRLDGMVGAMRAERDAILEGDRLARQSRPAAGAAEQPRSTIAPPRSIFTPADGRGGRAASARLFPSVIAGKTGRHNYTEWDQVLMGAGAAHPAMNPYNMPRQRRVPAGPTRRTCAPARSRSSTAR